MNSCWLSHLEFDWQSPVWRHFLLDLGRFATVVRYDERGFGMSDRDVTGFGLGRRVANPEAVADAAGLDRFALLGMSQGGPVAINCAARSPHRLTRLVPYGTYAAMTTDEDVERMFQQMIKVGWARPDSTLRRGLRQPHDSRRLRGAGRLARRVAGQGDVGRPPSTGQRRRP